MDAYGNEKFDDYDQKIVSAIGNCFEDLGDIVDFANLWVFRIFARVVSFELKYRYLSNMKLYRHL